MNLNQRNNRLFKALLGLFLATMVLPFGETQAALRTGQALAEDPRIFFTSSHLSLSSVSTVDLMLDAQAHQIAFVRIDLAFDPSKIRLAGEIQQTDLFTVIQKTSLSDANSTGLITIILALAPEAPAPAGQFRIAQLSFDPAPGFDQQHADIAVTSQSIEIVDLSANALTFVGEPGQITLSTFADVARSHWAWDFVERLYSAGITGGCSTAPLQYCPEQSVTRAQMAVFLLRGIHTSAYIPPGVEAGTGFGDVPADYWSASWIKQLAVEGITSGCGDGNYCPEQPVTRAQMAVFLLRSKYGASYTLPGTGMGTGFADVPPDYWAAAFIKQLVAEGITVGCGNGNYCPEQPVTRAQMAVFLVRTFGLP
jgi:hypothetical protein